MTLQYSTFWALSQALMGDPQLDERLCEAVMTGLSEGREPSIEKVLIRWAEAPVGVDPTLWIAQRLWSDSDLRRVCQDIILTWSFGQFFRDGKAQLSSRIEADMRATMWFSGSFWRLAKAHPPGLSGGYFGHWSYPGEA